MLTSLPGNAARSEISHDHSSSSLGGRRTQASRAATPGEQYSRANTERRLKSMNTSSTLSPRQASRHTLHEQKSSHDSGRSDRSLVSGFLHRINPFKFGDKVVWTVQAKYSVPRQVVTRCLDEVNELDCPQYPGMCRIATLSNLVRGFDQVLGNPEREELVAGVMEHLKQHTLRRRGQQVWNQGKGCVEWEQTSRVFELFQVDLNMFERIFFTVDPAENRAILAHLCSSMLMLLIVASNMVWAISTLPVFQEELVGCQSTAQGDCKPSPQGFFQVFETIAVYCFTIEFLVRLFTVHSVRFQLLDERFLHQVIMNCWKDDYDDEDESRQQRVDLRPSRSWASLDSTIRSIGSTHPTQETMDGPLLTTVKYLIQPTTLIDMLAILPYWLGVITNDLDGGGLVIVRVMRLTRIFRDFKLGGVSEALQIFMRVMRLSLPALLIMVVFITLLCCFFGTLIWFVEEGTWYPEGNPKLAELGITGRGAYLRPTGSLKCSDCLEESPFRSIIASFWFIVVTITTVGYGEPDVPTTPIGKIVASFGILCGVIVLAMPIGVIGTNFSHEYHEMVSEIDRRERAKDMLRQLAEEEKKQDELVNPSEPFPSEHSGDRFNITKTGVELKRVQEARASLLKEAEALCNQLSELLPKPLHAPLCRQVQKLMCEFLNDTSIPEGSTLTDVSGLSIGNQSSAVSLACLANLDEVTERAHHTITSMVSLDADGDPPTDGRVGWDRHLSCRQARDLRRAWDGFAGGCWSYAVEVGGVQDESEPLEFFQLKAEVEQQTDFGSQSPTSVFNPFQRAARRGHIVNRLRRRMVVPGRPVRAKR